MRGCCETSAPENFLKKSPAAVRQEPCSATRLKRGPTANHSGESRRPLTVSRARPPPLSPPPPRGHVFLPPIFPLAVARPAGRVCGLYQGKEGRALRRPGSNLQPQDAGGHQPRAGPGAHGADNRRGGRPRQVHLHFLRGAPLQPGPRKDRRAPSPRPVAPRVQRINPCASSPRPWQELESVAKFIRQRGRVSMEELAENSNNLVTLETAA